MILEIIRRDRYTRGGSILLRQGMENGEQNTTFPLPRILEDLSSKSVISVSANYESTACVTKNGEVYSWGAGRFGKLGHGDEVDQYTPGAC
jgi:alpha-tubulin suppressor-like RCC1 family protein